MANFSMVFNFQFTPWLFVYIFSIYICERESQMELHFSPARKRGSFTWSLFLREDS